MIVHDMQSWVDLFDVTVFGIDEKIYVLGPIGQKGINHSVGVAVIPVLIECGHN
jgi:hypothetical protein